MKKGHPLLLGLVRKYTVSYTKSYPNEGPWNYQL
jgi:hypothetical protein